MSSTRILGPDHTPRSAPATDQLEAAGTVTPAYHYDRRTFGPYTLEGEISRGGMGIVYRARDPVRGIAVALKVMRVGAPSTEELERFELEMAAARELDHPNIVRVLDTGHVDGQPYYTMELVEGQPLNDLIKSRVLTRDQNCRLAIEIAEALQHAHTNGLLHRDLKPSNVLIDEEGKAKLFDFGLAKRLAPDARKITETGFVVGTPNYMSPEQARGERVLTPASDLFSLGTLFYEMLTGEMAFPGNDGHSVLETILEAAPVRPTTHDPTIEPALEVIVLKSLQREIDDRYLSAAVFAQDIRNVLEERALIARPPGLVKRGLRFLERHDQPVRWLLVSAALVAVVVIWHLYEVKDLRGRLTESGERVGELDLAWSKARAELKRQQARTQYYRGLWLAERKQYGEALRAFRAAAQADPQHGEANHQTARMLFHLAVEAHGREDLPLASVYLRESTALDAERVEAQALLARVQLAIGHLPEAEEAARAALAASPTESLRTLLGQIALESGRVREALRAGDRATREQPDNPAAWRLLGGALAAAGEPARALGPLGKAVAIDPTWRSYEARARVFLMLRRHDDALSDCYSALARARNQPAVLLVRSQIYARQRRPREARADLLAIVNSRSGVPLYDEKYHAIAYFRLERWSDALVAARRWSQLADRNPTPHRLIAHVLERAGQLLPAIKAWGRVLDLRPEDEHARAAIVRLQKGRR